MPPARSLHSCCCSWGDLEVLGSPRCRPLPHLGCTFTNSLSWALFRDSEPATWCQTPASLYGPSSTGLLLQLRLNSHQQPLSVKTHEISMTPSFMPLKPVPPGRLSSTTELTAGMRYDWEGSVSSSLETLFWSHLNLSKLAAQLSSINLITKANGSFPWFWALITILQPQLTRRCAFSIHIILPTAQRVQRPSATSQARHPLSSLLLELVSPKTSQKSPLRSKHSVAVPEQ